MERAFVRRDERIQRILEIAIREGIVYVADMAKQFDRSKSMIGRDFNVLRDKGLVERLNGKAIPTGFPLVVAEADVLPATAMALAQLIGDNQAIILEAGAVSLQLAQHVSKDLRIVVVTNSPAVAMTFSNHPKVEVWVIGGKLRSGVLIPTKKEETQILQRISAALCVLGTCNLDLKTVSTPDSEQAELKSEMMSTALKVAVSVSDESLGSTSSYFVGPLNRITHIIPASDVSNKKLKPYEKVGINIVRG
ncbi:MAG: DeoR/GlpR transcriptional regulator [Pyrinomonadaceae bacterium]|nr:DeoR/GlpR transcriptional regulator [Pyrinomonadaceae bacterium]